MPAAAAAEGSEVPWDDGAVGRVCFVVMVNLLNLCCCEVRPLAAHTKARSAWVAGRVEGITVATNGCRPLVIHCGLRLVSPGGPNKQTRQI